MFKRKAKSSVKEEFDRIMQSGELATSSVLIKQKKEELFRRTDELEVSMKETGVLASSLVDKLKAGPKLFKAQTSATEGVLFIDYRGQIIHANKAICACFEKATKDLVGKQVEYVLVGPKEEKLSFIAFSAEVLASSLNKPTSADARELTHGANLELVLEPASLVIRKQVAKPNLTVRLSLLDTSPKELEDVTYICYISKLS